MLVLGWVKVLVCPIHIHTYIHIKQSMYVRCRWLSTYICPVWFPCILCTSGKSYTKTYWVHIKTRWLMHLNRWALPHLENHVKMLRLPHISNIHHPFSFLYIHSVPAHRWIWMSYSHMLDHSNNTDKRIPHNNNPTHLHSKPLQH